MLACWLEQFLFVQHVAVMSHIDHLASGKEVHQQDTFSNPEDHCCNFAYRVECLELLYWQGVSAFPYHGVYMCSWCVI